MKVKDIIGFVNKEQGFFITDTKTNTTKHYQDADDFYESVEMTAVSNRDLLFITTRLNKVEILIK